jgi:hypothetical protein
MGRPENPPELMEVVQGYVVRALFSPRYGGYVTESDVCVLPGRQQCHTLVIDRPVTILDSRDEVHVIPDREPRFLVCTRNLPTERVLLLSKYGAEDLIDNKGLFPDGYFEEGYGS